MFISGLGYVDVFDMLVKIKHENMSPEMIGVLTFSLKTRIQHGILRYHRWRMANIGGTTSFRGHLLMSATESFLLYGSKA